MKIPSIQTGPDLTALAKRNEPAAAGAAKPAATAGSAPATAPATAAPATAAMRQILAQYDVTDISPSEFSDMVQQLQQSGYISPQDTKDLAAIRMDLEQAGIDPNQSINLVDFYRERVEKAQEKLDDNPGSVQQQQLQSQRQRLQWVETLAAGHAHPEDIGLSTTA
jgi:pyruvate/2-oxoglutarate dehydrogenase complex dihydrolipoamide acyltransferase (E2) component